MATSVTIDNGPGRVNFRRVVAGTDLVYSFDIEKDGVPVDISGDTFEAFIVTDGGNIDATCTYDVTIEKVVVLWTDVQTLAIEPGCYEYFVYRTVDDVTTCPIAGKIEVIDGGK
jgi:uncharacterized protein YndB with AHSA1/START domain